ncbi:MAG: aspartate dehydrogenase domain-containing protein [Candidatus Omnitrophota bacterium]
MKKKIKVGIIGGGTIGTALAQAVVTDLRAFAQLKFLCEKHKEKAAALQEKYKFYARLVPLTELVRRSDLIIEAASPKVAAQVVRLACEWNKKVLIMSVGGLLQPQVVELLKKNRSRIFCPSGAITGVDGVLAAANGKIRKVRLITRKPPEALIGAAYFLKKKFPVLRTFSEEKCVFRGAAIEAIDQFPQNINVAAVLSLAGIGPERTQVEIWTSRSYKGNRHEILVEGDFGTFTTITQNKPAPGNPKTSYLAILAAIATLKKAFASVRVGT